MKKRSTNYRFRYFRCLAAMLLMTLTTAISPNSNAGVRVTHGGDPDAAEFLTISDQLASFFSLHKEEYSTTYQKLIWELKKSFADNNIPDKVEAVEHILYDSDGTQKSAVFNTQTRKIQFQRKLWHSYSLHKKIKTVALETLGLAGIEPRYLIVESDVTPYLETIKSIDEIGKIQLNFSELIYRILDRAPDLKPAKNEKQHRIYDVRKLQCTMTLFQSGALSYWCTGKPLNEDGTFNQFTNSFDIRGKMANELFVALRFSNTSLKILPNAAILRLPKLYCENKSGTKTCFY